MGEVHFKQIPRKTLSSLVRILPKRNSSFLEGGREWGNSGCSSNQSREAALALPWLCPGSALAMPWLCPSNAPALPWLCPSSALAAAAAALVVALGDEGATLEPPSKRQPQDLSWQEGL